MSKSTEYREWIAEARKLREGGDVGEFVGWYVEHPSPLSGGVFGRPLTRPEIRHRAVLAVATWFAGTGVEVTHAEASEDVPGMAFTVSGKILGSGYITVGGTSQDGLMLQTEVGQFVAIPVRNVVGVENAEG